MASVSRTYTINLRHALRECPDYKKTKKAIAVVKRFLLRHMKSDDVKNIKIGDNLNKFLWQNGIQNPPRRFTVSVLKENDMVYADLEGHDPAHMKSLTKEAKEHAKKETEKKKPSSKKDAEDVKEALGGKKEEQKAEAGKETKAEELKEMSHKAIQGLDK